MFPFGNLQGTARERRGEVSCLGLAYFLREVQTGGWFSVLVRDFSAEGYDTVESERKSMVPDFEDYMDGVKSSLDLAFKAQLLSCLRNIPSNDIGYLIQSLEAGKKIRGCLTCMISEALDPAAFDVFDRFWQSFKYLKKSFYETL